jgi:hypothetical protein
VLAAIVMLVVVANVDVDVALNVIIVLATLAFFFFTFASMLSLITYFLQMVVQLCLKLWLVFVVSIV